MLWHGLSNARTHTLQQSDTDRLAKLDFDGIPTHTRTATTAKYLLQELAKAKSLATLWPETHFTQ